MSEVLGFLSGGLSDVLHSVEDLTGAVDHLFLEALERVGVAGHQVLADGLQRRLVQLTDGPVQVANGAVALLLSWGAVPGKHMDTAHHEIQTQLAMKYRHSSP